MMLGLHEQGVCIDEIAATALYLGSGPSRPECVGYRSEPLYLATGHQQADPPAGGRAGRRGVFPQRQASDPHHTRSEEHTSELQSREKLVCRLLLEKK